MQLLAFDSRLYDAELPLKEKNHSGWKIIAEWSLPGFTEFKSTVFPSRYCFTPSHMEFTEHV